MSRVAQEVSKKGIRPGVRNLVLEICCTDANDEDAEVPYIEQQRNYQYKEEQTTSQRNYQSMRSHKVLLYNDVALLRL